MQNNKYIYILFLSLLLIGGWFFFTEYSPLLVTTGSMEPKIPQGSLVLVGTETTARKGEVITYKTEKGSLVTHRVVEIEKVGWENFYKTKGDANEFLDNMLVSSHDIKGKVVFVLPYLGYVIKFLISPLSLLFFFYIPIGYAFGGVIKKFVNQIRT